MKKKQTASPEQVRGQIHLYTGDGKGKTTAALGLSLRAAGAGKKVLFTQFVKGKEYHEIALLKSHHDLVTFRNYGRECFFHRIIGNEDRDAARNGFADLLTLTQTGQYDLVVLDEFTIALFHKLLSMEDLNRLTSTKPDQVELVITGRYAPQELMDLADLVTEMKEVKHYYKSKHLLAREGIEF
jgi:cob(I)alamin adenosyltransferase